LFLSGRGFRSGDDRRFVQEPGGARREGGGQGADGEPRWPQHGRGRAGRRPGKV